MTYLHLITALVLGQPYNNAANTDVTHDVTVVNQQNDHVTSVQKYAQVSQMLYRTRRAIMISTVLDVDLCV